MTENCYWNYALTGLNGRPEGKTVRKYRDYYFRHYDDITLKQLADHFGISESTMQKHSHNFQWKAVMRDKKAYDSKVESEECRQKREAIYESFIEKDYKTVDGLLSLKYTQMQVCAIILGWLPNENDIKLPDISEKEAFDYIASINPNTLHKMLLRDLEKDNYHMKIALESKNTIEHKFEPLNPFEDLERIEDEELEELANELENL